jgi:hypothetical protein
MRTVSDMDVTAPTVLSKYQHRNNNVGRISVTHPPITQVDALRLSTLRLHYHGVIYLDV